MVVNKIKPLDIIFLVLLFLAAAASLTTLILLTSNYKLTPTSPEHETWANLARYSASNAKLSALPANTNQVVFIGDSIIDWWTLDYYFPGRSYINRGIAGQTTSQMLLRFRSDVIELHPQVVVILGGLNDLPYNNAPDDYLSIIKRDLASMAELAVANDIQPIMASMVPVCSHVAEVKGPERILELNSFIKSYCEQRGLVYVDYYSRIVEDGELRDTEVAPGCLHPSKAGYWVMAPLIEDAIEKALSKRNTVDKSLNITTVASPIEAISTETCQIYPSNEDVSIGVQEHCYQAPESISAHCEQDQNNSNFQEVKSIDIIRQDLSRHINDTIQPLYEELERFTLSSYDKIIEMLDNAANGVIEDVRGFIKERGDLARREIEVASLRVKARLRQQITSYSYEKLRRELTGDEDSNDASDNNNNDNDNRTSDDIANGSQIDMENFAAIVMRDSQADLKALVDEILGKTNHMKTTLEKRMDQWLLTTVNKNLVFPPEKRDTDINVIVEEQMIKISKSMEKSSPSICLGEGMDRGIHSFDVKIDSLSGSGWVGMGFIDNDQIGLAQNNYAAAACICSDNSFYRVSVTQRQPVTVGVVYHFEADLNTGQISITGDNGLVCKAEGYQGKTVFPFFEITHRHQITVFNYRARS